MDLGSIAFRGVRNSVDFVADLMDHDWRVGVAKLSPNVTTPLAFLASLSKREKAAGPLYDWFSEKEYMGVVGITGIYTDILSTAYNPGQQSECVGVGGVLYFKMSEDEAKRLQANHRVRLSDADLTVDLQGDVMNVVLAGASSYCAVKMIQADTYVSGGTNLKDATYLIDLGMAAPEYSTWGDPKARDPEHYINYTQIFHAVVAATGTQLATSTYRISDPYAKAKADAALDMNRDMERAFLFGRRSVGLGQNNMPRRTTGGLTWFIETYAAANRRDFRSDVSVGTGAVTWLNGGMDWIELAMQDAFKWGSDTRLALVGDGTLSAINALVKNSTTYNIYHGEKAYGINISILETPFGILAMHRHQLFTTVSPDNNRMLIVDPGNLGIKDLRPFAYKKDLTRELGSAVSVDGVKEGYIAECGTLIDHPSTMMDLRGFGYAHPSQL